MSNLTQLEFVFVLLAVFQLKQFIADFPLQREYMLRKVSPNWDFLPPLLLHCSVHGSITLLIVSIVDIRLWWLVIFDFVLHFIMDRIKAGPRYLGRYNDKARPAFWICFGFDQMFHHFTHYTMIWILAAHVYA